MVNDYAGYMEMCPAFFCRPPMTFTTPVHIPPSHVRISYAHRITLFGSCFAEAIGARLVDGLFCVDLNPFGTLYNPLSVATVIERLWSAQPFTESELIHHADAYHSPLHHSDFSAPTATECLRRINDRLAHSARHLAAADRLIITFGTAYVYRWRETGAVVGNCHKLPEHCFTRTRLTVDEIVRTWADLMDTLQRQRPTLQWLFTVSPVRHLRDGAHENALSKSTLLLAVDQLVRRCPERADYFPAYEIMMDELRDYRFYADDMCHPSPLAVRHIGERFEAACMDPQTRQWLSRAEAIHRDLQHKPFHPDSEAHRRFVAQTTLKLHQLQSELPCPPTFESHLST